METRTSKKSQSTGNTLNRPKALETKTLKCKQEHLHYEMKAGKKFVIEFSTGAYELIKAKILQLIKSPEFNLSFVVVEQHGVELSNLNIDSCYKIFNRKANNQPGNLLKFTMNLYHTTNKMTVNGGRVDIFINDIFDKICAEIQNHYTELNICNKTIHSQLSTLKTTEDQLSTVDLNTSGLQLAEKEDGEICPNCEQAVQTEGIACDSCNNWFHYKCVGLTEDHINSFQQLEYHCDQCNDDLLYVGATFIPQTDENNQELLINTSSSEPAISSHETQDHPKDICMDSPAQKSSLESPTGTYLNPCITSCHNQSANNSEKEDTMVKSVLTHTSGDSTSSNRNPITDRGKSAKRNISPTSRSSNNQRKSKVKSSDLEHDQTLITQRTRILDLENEVNQLRTVLQTFKDHIKHQSDPAEIGPSHQNSNHSFRIDANPHFNPRHRNDTNSPWSPQHLDTYYKQELLENRLRILENQTAQNMSINTALITQLSLQNRPMGHYHPPFQHNLHQSHYPPQQPVPLLPQWNMHPAYSQTQFSNHPGFMQHQPQPQFQTNSHLATGYPEIGIVHPVWEFASQSLLDVRKSMIKARMLTGTYLVQADKYKFSQYKINATCLLCHREDEDLTHVLTFCPALRETRMKYFLPLKVLVTNIIGCKGWEQLFNINQNIVALLLDFSVFYNLQNLSKTQKMNVESLTRDFCYKIHICRLQLLKNLEIK
ncbi:unnamed protein product [Mytilus edulis]|uniref:PHD-type domain-containing protein n=1 Tax=Mytilus edulis TaxID=6550 RepID=A0A8S3VJI4_MYTED|nr:unnamed protein product [Mytilus edulis]